MRPLILLISFLLACAPGVIGHHAKKRGESFWIGFGRALIAFFAAEAVLASELGEAPLALGRGDTVVRYSQTELIGFALLVLAALSFEAGWHLAGRKTLRARAH